MGQAEDPDINEISQFSEPIQALVALLRRYDNKGVIIGGIAASLLGVPRFTADIDAVFLVGVDDLPDLIGEAARLGIEPRISDPIEFAHRSRVLLLRHAASGIDIDLSLGVLPFEKEMVERSRVVDIDDLQIRLPTPEDLIIMKAIAHRPKDLEDIRTIHENNPNLDQRRIHFWLKQFGDALDNPGLSDEISKLLT